MLRPGFVGTISLLSGLVLAVPMGVVGFEFLRLGRPVMGLAFLGLAVALVWLPEFVRHRLPRPLQGLRQRIAGRLRRTNEDDR